MEVANIIFDLGGVVLTEDDAWLHGSETKKLLGGTEISEILEAWKVAWPDAKNGKTSEDEFFSAFLSKLNLEKTPELITGLKEIYRAYAGEGNAFSFLEKLKPNYNLYSLTNISRDWLAYKVSRFGLNKYFKLIVSSCGEGIGKPEKEIYKSLINKASIVTEESLFIDNFERNLIPAREMGFKTILFESYDQTEADLKSMGVKL